MPRVAKGHVEQLPSGSWRARVYAGVDPITQREIRLKATAKTEQQKLGGMTASMPARPCTTSSAPPSSPDTTSAP
jgi:hypothetical protein